MGNITTPEQQEAIYAGPVPAGYSEDIFRKTGSLEPTVLSSDKTEDIASYQERLKALQGIEPEPKETETLPFKKTEEQAAQAPQSSGGASDPLSLGFDPAKDPSYQANVKMLDDLKIQVDAMTQRSVDFIKQTYSQIISAQKEANRRSEESRRQSLIMGGSQRYAQLSSEGIMHAQVSYGLSQLADLHSKEQAAIFEAEQAGFDKNFKLMGEKIDMAEETRRQKFESMKEISKMMAEEAKKIREEVFKQEFRSSRDNAITDLISQGVTDPKKILEMLNFDDKGNLIGDIDFKEVNDIIEKLNKAPEGEVGQWLALKEHSPEHKNMTWDDFYAMKHPDEALITKERELQIKKLEKELAKVDSSLDPENIYAYMQQYAATGRVPIGMPKGTFGIISQGAKELPRATGAIVNRITGVADINVPAMAQEDYTRLYNIINNVKRLKELDDKRWGGVLAGTAGKVFGATEQSNFLAVRKAIIDDIQRMQSGAALTAEEVAFYSSYLPGRFSESFFLGQESSNTINNFSDLMNNRLKERLDINSLSLYGYSKVKISGKEYTVGDTIIYNGQQVTVLPDGSLSSRQ